MASAPDLLKPPQVAKRCQVSETTLRRWRAKGIGPPFMKAGLVVRYSRAGLEQWLEDLIAEAS